MKTKKERIKMRYIQGLIISCLLIITSTAVSAQCGPGAFICNDTIQVSVDEMCMATISADVILEQPEESCTYDIRFYDENENPINVPNNTVGVAHVGRVLGVKVLEANVSNPNSCWSYIRVEDKIPAIIECPDFPELRCLDSDDNDPGITDEGLARRIRNEILATNRIDDNCTDTASFEVSIRRNQLEQLLCTDDFGALRIIEFDLIGAGDVVLLNCVDTIFFSKFDTDEIDDPRDFINDDALECDGTYQGRTWEVPGSDTAELNQYDLDVYPNFLELYGLDETSFPHIDGDPLIEWDPDQEAFVRVGFCNINAAFTDLPPFEICGKSYKLIRSWTIIDWCKTSEPRVVNQIIEVKDTRAPRFSLPSIPDVEASANTCTMVVDLPEPRVTVECNDWTFCIAYKLPGEELYRIDDNYEDLEEGDIPDPLVLPIGTTEIKYTVKDECGNSSETTRTVDVEDVHPPLAVCDTRTVLTLNNNNTGKIFPPTIDDNSFDSCTDTLIFRIWREDGNTALNAPDFSFVKFDAGDINQDVRVMLEVEDDQGLTSRCWTTVEVKTNSSIVRACPSTVGTMDFCENFSSFIPEEEGLEAVELDRQETGCGAGYLLVQWIDTTFNTNNVLCTGDTIFFETLNTISATDFAIPQDITVTECESTDPTAQELASILNNSAQCSNYEVVYQDIIFSEKIFRNFTVLDLCSELSIMQHTQIIEIVPASLDEVNIEEIFQVAEPGVEIEMDPDGELIIPASFFNEAAENACISDLDIRVRVRGNDAYSESLTFTCDDISEVVVFDIEVALYDRDGEILSEKFTKLLINDNTSQACPSGSVNIAGLIKTENSNAVENVQVTLISADENIKATLTTDVEGRYAFETVSLNQYRVETTKNDDIINGVTTLDLVLMQQHILGLKQFDSPYKVIASDINNDERVSAIDLVELRKVLLGIAGSFSNNNSWRFVNADQAFGEITNPWGFNEMHEIGGQGEFDFVGVKIGDANVSVLANSSMTSSRSHLTSSLLIENRELLAGEKSIVNISNENNDIITGYQLSLKISNNVQIKNVLDGRGYPLNSDEWVMDGDVLKIAHITAQGDEQMSFSLEIISQSTMSTNQAITLTDAMNNEWYSTDFNTINIDKVWYTDELNDVTVTASPNPFKEYTSLDMIASSVQDATITVYDITGKVIANDAISLRPGLNQYQINGSDLSDAGIYLYEVNTGDNSTKGKIIYVE